MDHATITSARDSLRNVYGAELATKASDTFCLAYGLPAPPTFAGLEEAGGLVQPRAAVLEFTLQGEIISAMHAASASVRKSRIWSSLQKAVARLQLPELNLTLQAAQLLRQAEIKSVRDDFYKAAGGIRTEVERGARGFHRPGPEATASPLTPSAVTEICWLNRTVRTWVDPRLLAEVAADPRITSIDLPAVWKRKSASLLLLLVHSSSASDSVARGKGSLSR